jgi:putative salt-induced outer membrane protein
MNRLNLKLLLLTQCLRAAGGPLVVAISACLCASSAWPQAKADGRWRGIGGVAFAATSGNAETTTLSVNSDMTRATLDDKLALGGYVNYGRSEVNSVRTTTADRWSGFGQYDYNLTPAMFVFGKLVLEGDNVIQLLVRTSVAAGMGQKFIDSKEQTFSVFGGGAYSTDRYENPQTVDGRSGTRFSRSSLFLGEESSHKLSPSTSFKQRLDLYAGISGDQARIARFNAGLAVAMSSTLNLTLGIVASYNSRPPANTTNKDLGIFAGVNVKLGAE